MPVNARRPRPRELYRSGVQAFAVVPLVCLVSIASCGSSQNGQTDAASATRYVSCDTPASPDPACPSGAPPAHQTSCAAAGAVCDYTRDNGWTSCECRDAAAGGLNWECYNTVAGYDCPLRRPEDGAACPGEGGRFCAFVRDLGCTCPADRRSPEDRNVTCICDNKTELWRCRNEPSSQSLTEGKPRSEKVCFGKAMDLSRLPIDENLLVMSLTDTDATAWCRWFVARNRGDGPPPPRQAPITNADGSVTGYAFVYCGPPTNSCIAAVSEDVCLTSLRRRPCEAPLRALNDCYLTHLNQCERVGAGCEALRVAPGCLETVVQLNQDVGPDKMCTVPLR